MVQDEIEKAINRFINDFSDYPNKYLTESDMRCLLFSELLKMQEYCKIQETEDNSKSIPLHSEIRWYSKSKKLKFRSDIVILDVKDLIVKSGKIELPSKGYGFNIPKAIIELKFRKINGKSNNKFISDIRNDIDRLKKIKFEMATSDFPMYLVIFDKKQDIESKLDDLQNYTNEDRITLFYKYSNDVFLNTNNKESIFPF
ncbi:MAG: hypothetical protein WBK20_11950 [Spirochaetota bacterium]